MMIVCRPRGEVEPIVTYRHHSDAVTCVAVSTIRDVIFSGSLDSTICIWELPQPQQKPYGPYDPSCLVQRLEGHTDAVWDVLPHPQWHGAARQPQSGQENIETQLVSVSADKTFKVWTCKDAKWSLTSSHEFGGRTPTCLASYTPDGDHILVGFDDGTVLRWDVKKGKEVMTYGRQGGEWSGRRDLYDGR